MFPEDRFMELLIIGALALIVVGPKDLPVLMRKVGQFVGKMRGMANEFRASFDELARQSELEELRREVEAMRVGQQSAIAKPDASTMMLPLTAPLDPQLSLPLAGVADHEVPSEAHAEHAGLSEPVAKAASDAS